MYCRRILLHPVTTNAYTTYFTGVPPKNFLQVIQDVAKKTGDETVKLGKTVGQKTKELTDHVGRETVKIQDNLKPHVDKIGENTDREIKKHQESARVLGETIGRSTRELTATVGAQSVKIATNVGSTTREVAEHVGKESGKIADAVGKESVKIADAVGKETKKHYDKVAPVVEPHAKKYSSLINGTMADLMATGEDRWWKQMLDGTARAYGRVVLCDNPFTGLMISLAILFGSPVAWIVSLYCAALVSDDDDDGIGAFITCVEPCIITPKSLRSSPHIYVCLLFINGLITTTPYRPTSPQRSSV